MRGGEVRTREIESCSGNALSAPRKELLADSAVVVTSTTAVLPLRGGMVGGGWLVEAVVPKQIPLPWESQRLAR